MKQLRLSHTRFGRGRLSTQGLLAMASLFSAFPGLLMAQSVTVDKAVLEDLQKQVRQLSEEVNRLKQGPSQVPPVNPDGDMGEKRPLVPGLKFGFYGEAKYRFPEKGSARFDPHRFVLTPSYQINDWLIFNSELELEHGGVDESTNGGRNRFDGELEIEQMFVDVMIHEHFNVRSLGIDLVPVGRVNKTHEPTTFYSTERPELYREIIPSTWFEPSIGFFGKIVESLDYQVMISTGLEDFIPAAGASAPGIEAGNGMRNARPRYRGTSEDSLAYSGQVRYRGVPGLDASASFYITKVDGTRGESTVTLWDLEALYRIPRTGLEFRAEVAYWDISDPRVLVANNDASASNDVGSRMYGWYGEMAYHFWPEAWSGGRGAEMDLVPFVRFSQIRTQSGLLASSVPTNNGTRNRDFLTFGLSYYLNRNFVIKGDYRRNLDGTAASESDSNSQDYFQLGAGVFF